MPELRGTLFNFKDLINKNSSVRKLLVGWEPVIEIEALDGDERYTLIVRDRSLEEIHEGPAQQAGTVTVRGNKQVLSEIFEGKLNPAQALIDGQIEIYGQEKDMIKLDALTLVLWDV